MLFSYLKVTRAFVWKKKRKKFFSIANCAKRETLKLHKVVVFVSERRIFIFWKLPRLRHQFYRFSNVSPLLYTQALCFIAAMWRYNRTEQNGVSEQVCTNYTCAFKTTQTMYGISRMELQPYYQSVRGIFKTAPRLTSKRGKIFARPAYRMRKGWKWLNFQIINFIEQPALPPTFA